MSAEPEVPSRPGRAWILCVAAAFALGTWLRLHQIGLQIVNDDELHALRFMLEHGPLKILSSFGISDHSIPLTLYDLAVGRAIGLSELWMRAPALLAGLLALVALPLALRPLAGGAASAIFAWLLAISPLHTYFSRYARPYAITFLLVSLGTLAFLAWWRGGRRRDAVVYGLCATVGTWIHLVLLPYALAPLAWAGLLKLLRRAPAGAPSWGALVKLGAAVLAGLALFLGPPLLGDPETLAARAGTDRPTLEELLPTFHLLTGAHRPLLGFAFGLALLHGVYLLRRRAPALLGLLAFGFACQVAAILVSSPSGIQFPIVPARYLLPSLLLVLLAAAFGLVHLDELLRAEAPRAPRHAVPALVLAALLAFGPMAPLPGIQNRAYFTPNSWTNHALFQYQYSASDRHSYMVNGLWTGRMSPFYGVLGDMQRNGGDTGDALLEAPWVANWGMSPFVMYQRVHRLPVHIGFIQEFDEPQTVEELPLWDARLRMRHFVHVADRKALRRKGVRFVVFHKDISQEVAQSLWHPPPDPSRWIERYKGWCGEPAYEDELLCVFDLRGAP